VIGKLAFFAAGYFLGTRAGRERYHQMVALGRWVAGREEVQTALGLAQSALQLAMERGQAIAQGKRAA
jgi:hypothetical protein